jgi:hypothetical protein
MALPTEPTPQKYRLNAAPRLSPAILGWKQPDAHFVFHRNIPRFPSAMLGGTRAE